MRHTMTTPEVSERQRQAAFKAWETRRRKQGQTAAHKAWATRRSRQTDLALQELEDAWRRAVKALKISP